MEQVVPLRITVIDPPVDVLFALQGGRSELHQAVRSAGGAIHFDFTVRARSASGPHALTLLGPFTQGSPASRFVYVNSGTYAGDPGSSWSRRAKVPLGGITLDLMHRLEQSPGSRLVARIAGTARDGGPACATVPLVDGGWRIMGEAAE